MARLSGHQLIVTYRHTYTQRVTRLSTNQTRRIETKTLVIPKLNVDKEALRQV